MLSESTDLTTMGVTNISGIINIKSMTNTNKKNILKHTKHCTSTELTKMFNNLPNDSHTIDITVYNNLQKAESFMINQNILESYTTNMTTYNSVLQSVKTEDQISYPTTLRDFSETDLISSTKVNYSDNM